MNGTKALEQIMISAAVIEQVTGHDYETFLSERLFAPAEMTFTGYRLSSWDPDSVAHWYAASSTTVPAVMEQRPNFAVMSTRAV